MIYKSNNLNKPYTRLWIYGGSATNDEIDLNIKYLKAANIGGVELQVVYPLSLDNNEIFFSKSFFKMINYFIDNLHKNHISVDLTLGSGWPFGAPFITKDMSPDILIPYQQDIKGPQNYSFNFTNILSGKIIRAILCRVEDAQIIEESLIDVTNHVKKTYISVWPWGEEITNVKIPAGNWRLFIFVSNEYRQQVGKAAPNMNGYVMDHCRKDVTNSYINNFANVYLDNIDSSKIRSVFCDSIELTASNWTKYLLDEFYNDHGYDLSKYLPALWMNIGDKTPYIRHDYYETYGRLTIENFFKVFKDWANNKGVKFRLQAHGTWADIIDAYGASHIPEGETFGFGDSNSVNINHRRLAVSSGIIYNKKIVSNESYTWLRKPRFLVTLEILKRASDAIFCDGINHIINHGYSFYKNSRYENIFYASSLISPHNSWFKHYHHLSYYLENCMNILQNTKLNPNVVIFTPTSTIWATNIMSELHMSLQIENHFTKEMANLVHRAGYWYSFINDYALTNPVTALVIIVPKIEYIKLESLKMLVKLSKTKKIIFTDFFPSKLAGLSEFNKDIQLKNLVTKLQNSDNVFLINHDELYQFLTKVTNKDFICDNKEISYINRFNDFGIKHTFVANITNEYQSCKITLDSNFKIYDPIIDNYVNSYKYENKMLYIDFKPNQSLFIIEDDKEYKYVENYRVDTSEKIKDCIIIIDNNKYPVANVTTFEKISGYHNHSDDVTYIFEFNTDKDSAILKIPYLYGVAKVYLNETYITTIWHLYECYLTNLDDHNILEIIITPNIFNEALVRNDEVNSDILIEQYPHFNDIIEQNKENNMFTWRENIEHPDIIQCGIDKYIELEYIDMID